jgi:hypothetical protein
MKKPKFSLFLLIISCSVMLSCENDLPMNDLQSPEVLAVNDWPELLDELLTGGEIMFVTDEASLEQAMITAGDNDLILVEGGTYSTESIQLNKGVLMLGLNSEDGTPVTFEKGSTNMPAYKGRNGLKVIKDTRFESDASGAKRNKGFNVVDMIRTPLSNQLVHYTFELKVGDGEFDVIRVHRVVKERKPYKAARTHGELFMIHGASQNFTDIFFWDNSEEYSPTPSPVYLAENGIDVWGIDLGWTLVPLETTDFGFMAEWGVERDARDTQIAMAFARLVRTMSGSSFRPLNLLGFSYGSTVAYAAANEETQLIRPKRDIKGLIPVDQMLKTDNEEARLGACAAAQALIASGEIVNTQGIGFSTFGNLAYSDPDGLSPIPPFNSLGLTNRGVTIFLGANTYLTGGPAGFWHFCAGNGASPADIATDFQHTSVDLWIALLRSLPPYQPVKAAIDVNQCLCDQDGVSFDDYLSEISVPIFYLGAGGATGETGIYSTMLTQSSDVSSFIVSLSDDMYNDFGHGDLFIAENAPMLVWEPLRIWLLDH